MGGYSKRPARTERSAVTGHAINRMRTRTPGYPDKGDSDESPIADGDRGVGRQEAKGA